MVTSEESKIINTNNNLSKEKMVNNAVVLSFFSSVIIVVIKSFACYKTGSMSIMSTMLDAFLDLMTSASNIMVIRFAMVPPNNEYRFGHYKIEDISVFTQSCVFLLSGIVSMLICTYKSYIGYSISENNLGIGIMTIVVMMNILLLAYQRYVIKKSNSLIIKSDYVHYLSDIMSHIAVIISLYFANMVLIDYVFSMLIGAYIVYSAIELIKVSFYQLIDRELDSESQNLVIKTLKKFPEVLGAHDLKTRKAGSKKFIQVHIELDPNMTLYDAHDVSDKISDEISSILEDAEVIIHQDPFVMEKKYPYKVF